MSAAPKWCAYYFLRCSQHLCADARCYFCFALCVAPIRCTLVFLEVLMALERTYITTICLVRQKWEINSHHKKILVKKIAISMWNINREQLIWALISMLEKYIRVYTTKVILPCWKYLRSNVVV